MTGGPAPDLQAEVHALALAVAEFRGEVSSRLDALERSVETLRPPARTPTSTDGTIRLSPSTVRAWLPVIIPLLTAFGLGGIGGAIIRAVADEPPPIGGAP